MRRKLLGDQHPAVATSLNAMGDVYRKKGELGKAYKHLMDALAIREKAFGNDHPEVAYSFENIGLLWSEVGQMERAGKYYEKTRVIRQRVYGKAHLELTWPLNNLAVCSQSQGDSSKALAYYEEALAIKRKHLGPRHVDVAWVLNNVGALHRSQKRFETARAALEDAVDALRIDAKGQRLPPVKLQAQPAGGAAVDAARAPELRATWKMPKETRPLPPRSGAVRQICSLAAEVRGRIRSHVFQAEETKLVLGDDHAELAPVTIHLNRRLFLQEGRVEHLHHAFHAAEMATARVFLESFAKRVPRISGGIPQELADKETRWQAALQTLDLQLDRQLALPLGQRDESLIEGITKQRRRIDADLAAWQVDIERAYPVYATLRHPRPCSVAARRACLAEDEVALMFVLGKERSHVLLLEKGVAPEDRADGIALFELPGALNIADTVAALADEDTLRRPANVAALGRELYQALLGPCQERIKGKSLVIVPNGARARCRSSCWCAQRKIPGRGTSHPLRPLADVVALHQALERKAREPEEPLLAIGDPVYAGNFRRLEQSGHEVSAIARLFDAREEFVLTRERASKEQVKKLSATMVLAKAALRPFRDSRHRRPGPGQAAGARAQPNRQGGRGRILAHGRDYRPKTQRRPGGAERLQKRSRPTQPGRRRHRPGPRLPLRRQQGGCVQSLVGR